MAPTPRTALVTGATSGLGFEAAAQLADAGYEQVIVTGVDLPTSVPLPATKARPASATPAVMLEAA